MVMCMCPCDLVWHRWRDMKKAAQPPCKYWLKYDLPSIRLTHEARTALAAVMYTGMLLRALLAAVSHQSILRTPSSLSEHAAHAGRQCHAAWGVWRAEEASHHRCVLFTVCKDPSRELLGSLPCRASCRVIHGQLGTAIDGAHLLASARCFSLTPDPLAA